MMLARARWCNGSTKVFGSFCPGSNPGRAFKCKRYAIGSSKHMQSEQVANQKKSIVPSFTLVGYIPD